MLARAAKVLRIAPQGTAAEFADAASCAPWARESVETVSSIVCGKNKTPLMQGPGNGNFTPLDYYIVEEAAIALYRFTQA